MTFGVCAVLDLKPSCFYCTAPLLKEEEQWRTGLCNLCYRANARNCRLCTLRIPTKQWKYASELCSTCYKACDKACRKCGDAIAVQDLDAEVGLCQKCRVDSDKPCKMCQTPLKPYQLSWGTGLCDSCYDGWHKKCERCRTRPSGWQKHWSTGLCDQCYGESCHSCIKCVAEVPLGSGSWRESTCADCVPSAPDDTLARKLSECALCQKAVQTTEERYSTGLCQECYTEKMRTCRYCRESVAFGQKWWDMWLCVDCHGAYSEHCKDCSRTLTQQQKDWGFHLCDRCFDRCSRGCGRCKLRLNLRELHWGTSICDTCHDKEAADIKCCKGCRKNLTQSQKRWGFELCDSCFDKRPKQCSDCKKLLDHRQQRWETGICDECYDTGKEHTPAFALPASVQAVIFAQFVFYLLPEMLRPGIFSRIQSEDYQPDAPQAYAWVQTSATVFSSMAPFFIAYFATHYGPRVVYCGICLAGSLAAALLLVDHVPIWVFALSWAVISSPPAMVRGLRQYILANTVPLEELNHAGQLASQSGVVGGFSGPMLSIALAQLLGSWGPIAAEDEWRRETDVFTSAIFITAVVFAASVGLFWSQMSDGELATSVESKDNQGEVSLPDSHSFVKRHMCECGSLGNASHGVCQSCQGNLDRSHSFVTYRSKVLICFCLVVGCLELSYNAGVAAAFQPVVRLHFSWTPAEIAWVSFAGSILSAGILAAGLRLRPPDHLQAIAAAGVYLVAVLIFLFPPLTQWRLVAGQLCGISAQIMFYPPFEAIFATKLGSRRVTTLLTTMLAFSSATGTALGNAFAPRCIAAAGGSAALVVAVPAVLGFVGMCYIGCVLGEWSQQQGLRQPFLEM